MLSAEIIRLTQYVCNKAVRSCVIRMIDDSSLARRIVPSTITCVILISYFCMDVLTDWSLAGFTFQPEGFMLLLQWSHAHSNVETRERPERIAEQVGCFNGATIIRTWKLEDLDGPALKNAALQWSHAHYSASASEASCPYFRLSICFSVV